MPIPDDDLSSRTHTHIHTHKIELHILVRCKCIVGVVTLAYRDLRLLLILTRCQSINHSYITHMYAVMPIMITTMAFLTIDAKNNGNNDGNNDGNNTDGDKSHNDDDDGLREVL